MQKSNKLLKIENFYIFYHWCWFEKTISIVSRDKIQASWISIFIVPDLELSRSQIVSRTYCRNRMVFANNCIWISRGNFLRQKPKVRENKHQYKSVTVTIKKLYCRVMVTVDKINDDHPLSLITLLNKVQKQLNFPKKIRQVFLRNKRL